MSSRKKRKSTRELTYAGESNENKSPKEKVVTVTFIDDEDCDQVIYGFNPVKGKPN